jgi:tetratricopeptide (TPR) repeat protein
MLQSDPIPALEDRLRSLVDELKMAIQWGRPSILIASYRSEKVKQSLQQKIAQDLEFFAQQFVVLEVDRHTFDLPILLRDHPAREHAVFFISGFRWGGGRAHLNCFRALNMHREYLVEGRVRSIFWATSYELRQLPRHAPDFWAFRHQTMEFPDLPAGPDEGALPSGTGFALALPSAQPRDAHGLAELARLALSLGCYEEAIDAYHKAIRLRPDEGSLYLGLAEVYRRMNRPEAVRRTLNRFSKITREPEGGLGRPARPGTA